MISPEVYKMIYVYDQGITLNNEKGRKKKKDSIPKESKTKNNIQGACIRRPA
jgi:hypothetical protein